MHACRVKFSSGSICEEAGVGCENFQNGDSKSNPYALVPTLVFFFIPGMVMKYLISTGSQYL